MRRRYLIAVLTCLTAGGAVTTSSPRMQAQSRPATATLVTNTNLQGGPRGTVKTSKGLAVEGLMVQLISEKTAIRTTVYTNALGQFEFPKLETAEYVLRIPRPLEFHPYVKKGVRIDGATRLGDIIVSRVTEGEFLPPTPELLPQLTPAEWLANMPGTAQEKRVLLRGCSPACHTIDYPFRVKYDEASWRKLMDRMIYYGGRMAISPPRRRPAQPNYVDDEAEAQLIVNWLSRIRSLDSEIPPIKPFPRPHGPATRAVITEYELPWAMTRIHDVEGDADGNIWFTINRSPFIGKLDPQTGRVVSYRIPNAAPPANHPQPNITIEPGLHWLDVDERTGIVWFSWNWAGSVGRLDPRTGDVQMVYTGASGNMGLAPDGLSIWKTSDGKLKKFDTNTIMRTGKPVKEYPLKLNRSTYGNFFSRDGRYFAGGGHTILWFDVQTEELREVPVPSGEFREDAVHGRGGFDPDGNVWVGGKVGVGLWKYDPKTGAISEYDFPTPHVNSYSAKADKNGDVWAGEMQGGRIARFKPRTHQWIEYVLPTSNGGNDFNSWIDNSTNPPTFWYGDDYGYVVRIQPLE